MEAFDGREPKYNYFSRVVTDYENSHGKIPGMFRDVRGTIYHPHTHERIPLGTLYVERYRRPEWTFSKVLYIEKEGIFENLIHEKWPEKHDCALMTAKGQSTVAAKDFIDFLAETSEPCTFYCLHDADAAGTMIYQCLQQATRARGARNVTVVNLGLEPAEGRAMGLQVETIKPRPGQKNKRRPVADYVPPADKEWLQHHRIELNAMTSPQLLAWLDSKFPDDPKLIPPVEVMQEQLRDGVREHLEEQIRDEILEEAGFDDRVEEAIQALDPDIEAKSETIEDEVKADLGRDRAQRWTAPVSKIAKELVDSRQADGPDETASF
jgi:hypothetical protein